MEWFVIQLIIAIIAPWALKYFREVHNLQSSFKEMFAMITLISFVLSFLTAMISFIPNPEEYQRLDVEELNNKIANIVPEFTNQVVFAGYYFAFTLIVDEIMGLISYFLMRVVDKIANRNKFYW